MFGFFFWGGGVSSLGALSIECVAPVLDILWWTDESNSLPQIFVRGETNDGGVVHFFVHACLSSESQDNATSLCTSETNEDTVSQ